MRKQRIVLGTAVAAAVMTLAGCGQDTVEPATTVNSVPSGSITSPAPSADVDPDVKRKALDRAQKALEKEKQNPRRFLACLNDDGTLAVTVEGTPGVGDNEVRKPYTSQEKKAICDDLKKERDARK